MSTLLAANKNLNAAVAQSCREGDGWCLEADDRVNDASRDVVTAMRDKHGQAWLGRINIYEQDRGKPVMWEWDGELVRNFAASFVTPRYDADLVQEILDRHNAEYTGTKDDLRRITAIYNHVEAIGGASLLWT